MWSLCHGRTQKVLKRNGQRNTFKALPASALARMYMGLTQSQRAKELNKAASQRAKELNKAAVKGDTTRLEALVNAGVDIDQRTEYGQAALYVAAYHNHFPAGPQQLQSI
ncbi:hypothetical protein T484DRAFT_1806520 [Baffinella frigidus]|nr:hypothetical protein T484DRAFT_1806520 [Cryptophyta sp. CCMP2293]